MCISSNRCLWTRINSDSNRSTLHKWKWWMLRGGLWIKCMALFYFCTSNPLANPSLTRFPCVLLQGKVQELALILTKQHLSNSTVGVFKVISSSGPGNKSEQSRLVLTCDNQLGPPRDHWPAEIWHLYETFPHPSLTHPPNVPSPWSLTLVKICWQCSNVCKEPWWM